MAVTNSEAGVYVGDLTEPCVYLPKDSRALQTDSDAWWESPPEVVTDPSKKSKWIDRDSADELALNAAGNNNGHESNYSSDWAYEVTAQHSQVPVPESESGSKDRLPFVILAGAVVTSAAIVAWGAAIHAAGTQGNKETAPIDASGQTTSTEVDPHTLPVPVRGMPSTSIIVTRPKAAPTTEQAPVSVVETSTTSISAPTPESITPTSEEPKPKEDKKEKPTTSTSPSTTPTTTKGTIPTPTTSKPEAPVPSTTEPEEVPKAPTTTSTDPAQ